MKSLLKAHKALRRHMPLEIGVGDNLAKAHPDIEPAAIQRFLKQHCNSPEYLTNLSTSKNRHKLSGKLSGWTTTAQRAHALGVLEDLKKPKAGKGGRPVLSIRRSA